jgi:thiamine kinase-like enzyme
MSSRSAGHPAHRATAPISVEEAIRRIPAWRAASSIRISPMPGGITNSNFRVDVDDEAFVLRIWASNASLLGIDRHREHQCMVAASQTGVGPEVTHFSHKDGLLVTRYIVGQSLQPHEAARPDVLARVIRAMHRYHGGPPFEGSFSPFRIAEEYLGAARRLRSRLPSDIEVLWQRLCEIEAALRRGPPMIRPCHNDLWGPNLIDDGEQVRIVDWEFAGMGDVYFDLANFAIYHSPSDAQDAAVLHAYFGDSSPARFARLQLMKIAAQFREATWYLVGVHVAGNVQDFVRRAAMHFDHCRQALADPRLPGWL